eukprot:1307964-Alexandrium_andersonii.AAC.1
MHPEREPAPGPVRSPPGRSGSPRARTISSTEPCSPGSDYASSPTRSPDRRARRPSGHPPPLVPVSRRTGGPSVRQRGA